MYSPYAGRKRDRIRVLLAISLIVVSPMLWADPAAVVLHVEGNAYVESGGVARDLFAGSLLEFGSTAHAGEDSTVVLLLYDKSRIVMQPGSVLGLTDKSSGGAARAVGAFFRNLWRAVAGKFRDVEESRISIELFGTIRGGSQDTEIPDESLSDAEAADLAEEVRQVGLETEDPSLTAILQGVILERWRQYASAEARYRLAMEQPGISTTARLMLVDLYMRRGAPARARELMQDAE